MMKNVRTQVRYWIAGIALAVLGVLLARGFVPTGFGLSGLVAVAGGRLLAGAGLLVLAVGVSRRVRRENRNV